MPCLLVALAMGLNLLKTTSNSEQSLAFFPEMFGSGSSVFVGQETSMMPDFGNGLWKEFMEAPAIGPGCQRDADDQLR